VRNEKLNKEGLKILEGRIEEKLLSEKGISKTQLARN
jgi:hypothetical protein